MKDLKKEAAQAALTYVKPNQTIGVGAGTTISHLVDFVKVLPFTETLLFATPSYTTKMRLRRSGLQLVDVSQISELDIYFDSCDHYDLELNALKSGGGIHTMEKLLASMAREFVLLVDESKFSTQIIHTNTPLCVEVLPAAEYFVYQQIRRRYPMAEIAIRMGQRKDGAVISDHGNILIDVFFRGAVPLGELNTHIKAIPGVVDHALFYRIANRALVATEQGITEIKP